MALKYQICNQCVMDTSDSEIDFDSNGICDHCRSFEKDVKPLWKPNEEGKAELEKVMKKVRKEGEGKEFDSILGLSGGLDSSYMLHLVVKEFGLRPLVFHVDGGWNSDIAVNNIQGLVEGLGLDLYTEVINWEEMKAFQLAFFKAGVPHLDIPQDHAFVGTLYHFANENGIRYILNGGNIATECVRNPLEWVYYGTDGAQLRDIRKRFCDNPMETYPFTSILFHKVYLRYIKRVEMVRPLNLLPYTKKLAMETLEKEYGWRAYPQKHFESRFTRFYEGYWLPNRFGFDTRRPQFSSLILTDQMTRDEALEKLESPAYPLDEAEKDFAYIASKLDIPVEELRTYFEMPKKSYRDYANQEWLFRLGARVLQAVGLEASVKR